MFKRIFGVLAAVALLAGCGGGGGNDASAPVYSGVTTQATVTTTNAKALSVDAYEGTQLSAAASGIGKEAGDGNSQRFLLQEASGILRGSITAAVAAPDSMAKVVAASAQNTLYGFSGSYSYSITYDPASSVFSGTITFSHYKETSTSPSLTGAITFTGIYNVITGQFASLTINLNNLSGSSGSKSYRLDGTMSYASNSGTETVTMSVLLTDVVSGRTYWVKNYILSLTGNSLTVSGTYYNPLHGFVVLSTITPLTVASADAAPTAGQLLFTGSNGTKVRLTFTPGGATVEVDTAGNGSYVVVP